MPESRSAPSSSNVPRPSLSHIPHPSKPDIPRPPEETSATSTPRFRPKNAACQRFPQFAAELACATCLRHSPAPLAYAIRQVCLSLCPAHSYHAHDHLMTHAHLSGTIIRLSFASHAEAGNIRASASRSASASCSRGAPASRATPTEPPVEHATTHSTSFHRQTVRSLRELPHRKL